MPRFASPQEAAAAQPPRSNTPQGLLIRPTPTTELKIAAIDPAQVCGWAVRLRSGAMEAGVWKLKPDRFSNMGSAMLNLRGKLAELLDRHAPDLVAFEQVRMHQGVDAAHWYGAIIGKIMEMAEERQIPCRGVHFAHIKQTATGKGNANKEAMLEAAKAHWPHAHIIDHNQADAMWIAETAALQT